MNFDPIKPYARLLTATALAAAVISIGAQARSGGKVAGRAESAQVIAAKNAALVNAAAALRAASAAIGAVNREAARRIAEADAAQQRADAAGKAAAAAQAAAKLRQAQFDRELEQARRDAVCDALMKRDLRKECRV